MENICNIYVEKIVYNCVLDMSSIDYLDYSLDKERFIKGFIVCLIYELELGINILTSDKIPFINVSVFRDRYLKDIRGTEHYNNLLTAVYRTISTVKSEYILQLEDIELVGKNVKLKIVGIKDARL